MVFVALFWLSSILLDPYLWTFCLEELILIVEKRITLPAASSLAEKQLVVAGAPTGLQYARTIIGAARNPPTIEIGGCAKYEILKNKITLTDIALRPTLDSLWEAAHEALHFRQRYLIFLSFVGFMMALLLPFVAGYLCLIGYPYWKLLAVAQVLGIIITAIPEIAATAGASACVARHFKLKARENEWLRLYTRLTLVNCFYGSLSIMVFGACLGALFTVIAFFCKGLISCAV